jgi:hypothetical protein
LLRVQRSAAFSYVAAGGFRGPQLYRGNCFRSRSGSITLGSHTVVLCDSKCSLFWKKVIHGSVFNATARQLLSPREEFRLVWAESERPHLDKCAGKRRREGQDKIERFQSAFQESTT